MSVLVAWRDNHVNFYDRYSLLLKEDYTDEQASECAVTSEVLCDPEKGFNSKASRA
jgi:hypothetical protein